MEYGQITGYRGYPNSWIRYINIPLILSGILWWAPYNITYAWPALMVGYGMYRLPCEAQLRTVVAEVCLRS